MKIHVTNSQRAVRLRSSAVRQAVAEVLSFLGVRGDEVAVYFVSEKRICALHKEFFDDPSPTDCISFPLDEGHLGEVFVCPQVAREYAKKRGGRECEEVLLYVVHGLLHLVGYDDVTLRQKRVMRKMEKGCMGHLKAKGISLGPPSS